MTVTLDASVGKLAPLSAEKLPMISCVKRSWLCLVLGLSACEPTPPPAATPPTTPPSASVSVAKPAAKGPNVVRILAMNDLHGTLQPPTGNNGNIRGRGPDGKLVPIQTGGVAYVATHLKRLREENHANVFVHAGDLTGATPLESALFHDEPPILVMNQLGLRFNAVGNHEFDRGQDELRRFQRGGCWHDHCEGDGATFPGATFHYLAANVTLASGATLFPSYEIADVGGEHIAFVGMTLQGTPLVAAARNLQGLTFRPEVETVNALVPELRAKGAGSIVVLLHQGGSPPNDTPYDGCGLDRPESANEPIVEIAKGLDPAVDVIVSAHSHRAYVCELSGKTVTSAAAYGKIITTIDLTFDPSTHRVTKKSVKNVPVTRDVPKDPAIDALVASYVSATAVRAERVVGHISADLSSHAGPSGESTMGDVIADAMLAATHAADKGGAVVALMNPGGIRAELHVAPIGSEPPGTVTYGKVFAVQPFSNALITVTLTGTQLVQALEEQFSESGRLLLPSKSLTYTYDRHPRTDGHHLVPGTLKVDGKAVTPTRTYRVTVNDFIYNGGDGFRTFKQGKDPLIGGVDVDALEAYFTSLGDAPAPLPPPRLKTAK